MNKDQHELMRLIRKRVDQQIPMTQIASELGVDVDDLCEFIFKYKEPRRRPYVRKSDPPITIDDSPIRDHWSLSQVAQRFANWKRQHDGAAEARARLDG
jgi:hypothetical protein